MNDDPVSTRDRRRARLVRFAVINLVLWILLAIVSGFLASQRINLGFEAFFRQGPATIVALVKESLLLRTGSDSTPVPTVTQEQPPAGPTGTLAPGEAATGEAARTPEMDAGEGPTLQPQPTATLVEPTATPVAFILSWTDPALERVLDLDAEMARSAVGRDVNIHFSESEINAQIPAFLERFPFLPYTEVSLDLHVDRVDARGRVTVLGIALEVEASGPVAARDCRLWAEIDDLEVLGVSTPGLFEREINLLLQDALAWFPEDYALCIEQMWMDESGVTFDGYRR